MKASYICVGNCMGEVSEEVFKSGKNTCGAKDCTKFGEKLVEFSNCECGNDNCCQSDTKN